MIFEKQPSFSDVVTIVSTASTARSKKPRRNEEPLVATGAKILPHARTQALRLADVDDLARFVLEQVHARIRRDAFEDAFIDIKSVC